MPNLGMTPEADQKRLRLLSMALRVGSFGYFVEEWPEGKVTWAPETYKIWGVDQQPGIPNRDWLISTLHPDDQWAITGWNYDRDWTEKTATIRIHRPDGETRHLKAYIERDTSADGTRSTTFGIVIDETDRLATATALQHSEQRFQSLFETSGAGVVITNARARILFVNKAFARFLGYQPSELLNRSIRDLSPPEAVEMTYDMVKDIRSSANPGRDVEKPYIKRDGSLVWARLNITRHVNAAGEEEFIGVMQDLTERRKAEERLRDSENLLNIAQGIGQIGHWVWQPSEERAEWSPELYRIMGLDRDQLSARRHRIEEYIHPDDLAAFSEMREMLMKTQTEHTLDFRILRPDGSVRYIKGRSKPPELTPNGLRIMGTMQDVTDSKRTEDVLRRETVKAEAANRAKTLFLANMSHELRTPLNAVLGFSQLLAMGTKGNLNPEQRAYVDNIVRGGQHLLRLISDVLDLSRIDSGHFSFAIEPVDARKVCSDVMSNFAQAAEARRIKLLGNFSNAITGYVAADEMRLTHVLSNLISNAIKYNRDEGRVVIEVAQKDKHWIRIAVTDNGQGIPWDRQSEVFQHFNRLGAETQAVEGTGIGLALSKRLVEEMGGVMGFASEPDVTTTFWFDLQKVEPRTALEQSHEKTPRANAAE